MTSSCPSTAPWARKAKGGRWPWTCFRSSGARRCGIAPRTCTGGLQDLLSAVPPDTLDPADVGEVAQLLYALRARSRATQYRLAAGEHLGPETSIDKVLVASAEQAVFDLVADGLGPERGRGRRPGRPTVAARVPLLAGGDDLRRNRRDPAEHHRPPIARPRIGPLMDDDDRELFERSIRHACETHSGAALDLVLDELGWHEALAEDPRTAISFLFELQGAANTTSSTLEAVLGSALGLKPRSPAAVVLPALGQWRAPGEIVGGDLSIRGLGTTSLLDRATAVVRHQVRRWRTDPGGDDCRPRAAAGAGDGSVPRSRRGDRRRRARRHRPRPGHGRVVPGGRPGPAGRGP